jgi:outer membrane protein
MRNISVFLSSLSVVAVLMAASCTPPAPKDTGAAKVLPVEQAQAAGVPAKIAYVNLDTLEAKYEVLKTKREEFKKRTEQMENELQRSFDQMNQDAEEVQKKAQANTLTQVEYEAAQKRLGQMQHSLQTRKQSLQDQLMKEQEDFNKDLKSKLDSYLEEYNKNHHYDYILSYSYAGSSLLYVNKQLEITKDVVDGLNAAAKNDAGKKK